MLSANKFSRILASCLSMACLVVLSSCSSSGPESNARAQDAKSAEPAEISVPDGSPKEILDFVKKFGDENSKKEFKSEEEFRSHFVKAQRMLVTAADKILAQKTEDSVALEAVQMKMAGLFRLGANNIGDSAKVALDTALKLKDDKREAVAKAAADFVIPCRCLNVKTMNAEERRTLVDDVAKAVESGNFKSDDWQTADMLSRMLSALDFHGDAADLLERIAKIAEESTNKKVRANAVPLRGRARMARLPGNQMEVEGTCLDGTAIDWASYRGKVVLVDFWATWCGPCVMELANVKQVYEKYHDKGFDVVGISLDNARLALDQFLEKEKLPWKQIYEDDIQRGEGWKCPMAVKYGINSIPQTMLVDKEGKVVSLMARGPELEKLVQKLLE